MRVLVSGGAGYLGGAVVRSCSRAGHDVRALVRRKEQARQVEVDGGVPVVGSVLEPRTLGPAVDGCDVIVHLAQAGGEPPAVARAVRVDGVSNLLAAARAAGTLRFLVGSGYWVYRGQPGVLTEESPTEPIGSAAYNFEAEQRARAAGERGEVEALVVRPGMVYGDGSWFRAMVDEIRAGTYRFVGDGRNRISPVALDDTGEAYRTIIDRGRSGSTYLVVDDEPVPTREFAAFVADALGAPAPGGIAIDRAAQRWGQDAARLSAGDRAASNARLRSLGWTPRYRTFREGVPRLLRSLREDANGP